MNPKKRKLETRFFDACIELGLCASIAHGKNNYEISISINDSLLFSKSGLTDRSKIIHEGLRAIRIYLLQKKLSFPESLKHV